MNAPKDPDPILPLLPQTEVWESDHATGAPLDLLKLLREYASRWPLLLLSIVGGGLLFYVLSFLKRPDFEADAVFLPPPSHPTLSDSLLGSFWPNGNASGNIYPGLLRSRSVVDQVIHALNLQVIYKTKDLDATRTLLRSHTRIDSDTSGFYKVSVTDGDPSVARRIADAYLEALVQVDKRLAVDSATEQEAVYERELRREKDALQTAQEELAHAQEVSGVVSPQSQTQSGLNAIDQLRVQIQAREVQLSALRQSQTDQAPDVVRVRSEISALQSQLHAMEQGSGGGAGAGLSAHRAPAVNLQFLRLEREVQFHQSLYEIMTRQFESATLQARASSAGLQVVDYPETPTRKSSPTRRLWAAAGAGICFLLVLVSIFFRDRIRVLEEDSERREALASFRQAVRRPRWTL